MDDLLARVGAQAATFAIRSGITLTASFAVKQVQRYIADIPKQTGAELENTRKRLEQRIRIITPALELIDIIAARGNTILDSTVRLTAGLRRDIQRFGVRVGEVVDAREGGCAKGKGREKEVKEILEGMKELLMRVEEAVPFISLALTTSGANISSTLPETVSPSRLLQASNFLTKADARYLAEDEPTQVGPGFTLKLYTIFSGSDRFANTNSVSATDITWKEEHAKCCVTVMRTPAPIEAEALDEIWADEYNYELSIVEDLNDGRYHEELEVEGADKPTKESDGFIPGRARAIPVHLLARLFFSASGRLLNIDEARTPVLVLKLNHSLPPPRKLMEQMRFGTMPDDERDSDIEEEGEEEEQERADENIEWLALELFNEKGDDEYESDLDDLQSDIGEEETDETPSPKEDSAHSPSQNAEDTLSTAVSQLNIGTPPPRSLPPANLPAPRPNSDSNSSLATLSLLEYILRLSALQTSEQDSMLNITDERISLFLRDDNGGAASRREREGVAMGDPRGGAGDVFATPVTVGSFGSGSRRQGSGRREESEQGGRRRGSGMERLDTPLQERLVRARRTQDTQGRDILATPVSRGADLVTEGASNSAGRLGKDSRVGRRSMTARAGSAPSASHRHRKNDLPAAERG
ncbi:Ran-specific GTPase-activating protein 30 [Saitoella coloradoensis]